jgi:hypothetical protein
MKRDNNGIENKSLKAKKKKKKKNLEGVLLKDLAVFSSDASQKTQYLPIKYTSFNITLNMGEIQLNTNFD